VYITYVVILHVVKNHKITILRSKGSAEDEITDNAPKPAKIRPMRVEMYGMNWNSWLGNNSPRRNP